MGDHEAEPQSREPKQEEDSDKQDDADLLGIQILFAAIEAIHQEQREKPGFHPGETEEGCGALLCEVVVSNISWM
jgi:hypothetical protein